MRARALRRCWRCCRGRRTTTLRRSACARCSTTWCTRRVLFSPTSSRLVHHQPFTLDLCSLRGSYAPMWAAAQQLYAITKKVACGDFCRASGNKRGSVSIPWQRVSRASSCVCCPRSAGGRGLAPHVGPDCRGVSGAWGSRGRQQRRYRRPECISRWRQAATRWRQAAAGAMLGVPRKLSSFDCHCQKSQRPRCRHAATFDRDA